MATLLPPPKRQKVYHGVPEPEKEPPKPSPHVVVQFVSEDDGQPLAPAVNLPANVTREGLEAIVNKLNTKVRIHYPSPMTHATYHFLYGDEDHATHSIDSTPHHFRVLSSLAQTLCSCVPTSSETIVCGDMFNL